MFIIKYFFLVNVFFCKFNIRNNREQKNKTYSSSKNLTNYVCVCCVFFLMYFLRGFFFKWPLWMRMILLRKIYEELFPSIFFSKFQCGAAVTENPSIRLSTFVIFPLVLPFLVLFCKIQMKRKISVVLF